MASPTSLKRTCDDAGLDEPLRDLHAPSLYPGHVSPARGEGSQRLELYQVTENAPPSTSLNPGNALLPASATSSNAAKPRAKKPRLTYEEREALRIEKELKERHKAEEKARKEEEKAKKEAEKESIERSKAREKAKKEEERRLKELEKEERRRAKEEQARIKMEEKKQKEEESNKKARSQLRMDAFFAKPLPDDTSFGSPAQNTHSPPSSRRSSISEIQAMEEHRQSPSFSITPSKSHKSDYERNFQEFPSKPNTSIAPHNRFSRDESGLTFAQKQIDEGLNATVEACEGWKNQGLRERFTNLLHMPAYHRTQRPRHKIAVKDIMAAIDGTTSNPIDLTDSQHERAAKKPLDMLKSIPVKYLKFNEDVRPPYTGTCTRLQNVQAISKLARNPFGRGLPDMDYEYDSEAEWEEPAEGEDLDSEGEEEPDDDDAGDEMDGFLDDEEAAETIRAAKRRPLLGDQEPICTGLCWETSIGQTHDLKITGLDWRLLKLDILMGKKASVPGMTVAYSIENPQWPIDPYCSSYWQPASASSSLQPTCHAHSTLMEPPRLPLHPINRQVTIPSSSALAGTPQASELASSATMKPAKAQRLIAPELLEEFKAAVQGSDLNKLAIVEILKKQFVKQPKDAIKNTLEMVAERVGTKNVEKRWVLKSGF